jgi:hypothetical protein
MQEIGSVSFEAALAALPKRPLFMEPIDAFAVATVPITAAMINGQLSAGAAARTAFEVTLIDESFGLWFVHGHGHRESWHLHADALALSANAAAVLRSHVLLFSTDVTGTTAFMVRAMAHYPQRVRVLMHSGANTGYRCGLLHSLSATEHVWRRYAWVTFTHPDVYLLPPAPMLLSHVLSRALATSAPFLDGAPGSADRHAALLATPTRMFWYGQRRPIAYLSDLFAFRPALLRAVHRTCCGTISGLISGSSSTSGKHLLWDNLSATCSFARKPGGGPLMLKPEMALAILPASFNVSVAVLPVERVRRCQRVVCASGSGVWHCHNTSAVAAVLEELRRGRTLGPASPHVRAAKPWSRAELGFTSSSRRPALTAPFFQEDESGTRERFGTAVR